MVSKFPQLFNSCGFFLLQKCFFSLLYYMWVFKLDSPYQFRCAPRPYRGGVITMLLRNENKGTINNISISDFGYYNGIMTINFSTPQMNEGDSFEIEVKENTEVIYRGKGYATEQTDLENFKLWL